MTSWFLIITILLVLSSSLIQARYRAHSKRRYSSFLPSSSLDDNHLYVRDENSIEAPNDESRTDTTKESIPLSMQKYQANDKQIEQFTRLLFERLNLKEAPNVTVNVSDATGFPSSIVKEFEQQTKEHQRLHQNEEHNFYRQQIHDEVLSTTERAILPGDYIPNNTCQRQLSAKLNLENDNLKNIDCFRFTQSSIEPPSLPTNQMINELRLYVKRNYFHLTEEQQNKLTPDMFQVYQIFRPTSNDTTHIPPSGLTDTIRLTISQVKELSDNWFELTIESHSEEINIQQLYKQLIMPWYALAIDRDLQSSSPLTRSLLSSNHHYHRQYHSKKHISYAIRSDNEDDTNKESQQQQQLPYMLVEYGDKIFPSPSKRRGTRGAAARPARGCHPSNPCCRRALTIDLDRGSNALNFVIYPRQFDIGECVGLCGTGGSSLQQTDVKNAQYRNEENSTYNLLLLQNSLHYNRSTTTQVNRPDQHSPRCCSYSRTSGLELMYTTTNGGPIIRKFIPNMVVEECKCGLPATIQEV